MMSSKNRRRNLIKQIIHSDSTFEPKHHKDGCIIWVGKCIHCNKKIAVDDSWDTSFTIEHIVPKAAGGTDDIKNLALSHGTCNHEKGIKHDRHVGKGKRADEVVEALKAKRLSRWRNDPPDVSSTVHQSSQ
jgi:hypothetical protein